MTPSVARTARRLPARRFSAPHQAESGWNSWYELWDDVDEQAVRARHVFDLRSFEIDCLEEGDLGIDHLPRNALITDLRPIEQFRQAHHPRALHLDFEQTLQASASLDRSRRYVFCCQFGLLSAHLAQQLTRAGFDAHHLRGGQPALMELAKSEPTRVRG